MFLLPNGVRVKSDYITSYEAASYISTEKQGVIVHIPTGKTMINLSDELLVAQILYELDIITDSNLPMVDKLQRIKQIKFIVRPNE